MKKSSVSSIVFEQDLEQLSSVLDDLSSDRPLSELPLIYAQLTLPRFETTTLPIAVIECFTTLCEQLKQLNLEDCYVLDFRFIDDLLTPKALITTELALSPLAELVRNFLLLRDFCDDPNEAQLSWL
jgi:hypothetical protein